MSHRPSGILSTLLILSLAVTSPLLTAEEETRWYDVEILLFMQKSQSYRDSEVWPLDYTLPDMETARELVEVAEAQRDPGNPVPFRQLDTTELKLSADAERIQRAPDLELLRHIGWRQPGMPQDRAIAVMVSIPDESASTSGTETAKNAQPLLMQETALPPRLEGTLRLILSRYLHIEADLLYREPLPEGAISTGESQAMSYGGSMGGSGESMGTVPPQQQDLFMLAEQSSSLEQQPLYRVYRMQQSRRMRSGELHYLDHPVFGLAVRVTPYEPTTLPESAPTQN